jgi:hypothetical protein
MERLQLGAALSVAPQLPYPGGDVWATQAEAVEGIAEDVARDYEGNRADLPDRLQLWRQWRP